MNTFRWVRSMFALSHLWLCAACSHTTAYEAVPTAGVRVTPERPLFRLILIGDAGKTKAGSPVLRAAAERASFQPELTAVVFLGDNLYPSGLPKADSAERAQRESDLLAQLRPFESIGAQVFFLPGNHDWAHSGEGGQAAVLRQQRYIEAHPNGDYRWIPKNAQPGPVCLDRPGVRLIFFDTQWWLHEYERPQVKSADVLRELKKCLHAPGREVVFMSHHPPRTYGPHGGFFTWRDHLFPLTRLVPQLYLPLPLLGSLYPLVRRIANSPQDAFADENRRLMELLSGLMQKERPLVWAAGHEHSLQVHRLERGAKFALVSGSSSKLSAVSNGPDTLFAQEAAGFMELEFLPHHAVQLSVHVGTGRGMHVGWRHWLLPQP